MYSTIAFKMKLSSVTRDCCYQIPFRVHSSNLALTDHVCLACWGLLRLAISQHHSMITFHSRTNKYALNWMLAQRTIPECWNIFLPAVNGQAVHHFSNICWTKLYKWLCNFSTSFVGPN